MKHSTIFYTLMASPQLKKTAVVAPTRRLINSGVVPTTQVRLKGISGQVIKPKAPVSPLKKKAKVETPAPTDEELKSTTPEPVATPEPVVAPEPTAEPASEAQTPPAQDVAPAPESPESTPEPAAEAPAETAPEAAAEAPAETAPEPQEEEADAAAQSDYDREMEEYNRQMEEYNRQMEEYNRQMAELAAQEAQSAEPASEEAPKPEAEPEAKEPEPEPAAKEPEADQAEPEAEPAAKGLEAEQAEPAKEPAVEEPVAEPAAAAAAEPAAPAPQKAPALKPAAKSAAKLTKKPVATGGLKKKAAARAVPPTAQPAAEAAAGEGDAAAPAPGMQDIDADMLAQLQTQANKKPIWKNKLFLIAVGGLVFTGGLSAFLIIQKNAENEAIIARNAKVMSVLRRAQSINEQKIETLADAKAKGVNVTFSPEEAEFLMNIVVNPSMKDDKGKPMFGNNPEGTAQLAVLGVGLACEENGDICKAIFERMEKEAPLIKPSLYRWLAQRLAATNIKGINTKLRKLADALLKNDDPKFRKREELVAYIWEAMVLRVEEKDIPTIIKQLETPEIGNQLGNALLNCLYNIIRMMDDPAKRAEVGDKMYAALNDSMRINASESLALSCSPKALKFFKKRAKDPKNWRTDFSFFANYGNDDVLPFLLELKEKAGDDKKNSALVQNMISGLFAQNHDRSLETAQKMMALIPTLDKVDVDTSEWSELAEKTDPNAAGYVGDDDPQLPELQKRMADIEESRKQKVTLVKMLSGMYDYDWVVSYLNKFAQEDDVQLSRDAKKALETVKNNRVAEEERRAKHQSRDKS